MISKTLQRKLMGAICVFIGLSFINFLTLFNLSFETKIFGLIQLKVIAFLFLMYVGWYLVYSKNLV